MTQTPAEQAQASEFDHHRGRRPLLRETGRARGVIFVTVNLGAFAFINSFLYYLSSGVWLDFSLAGYRRALAQGLGDILLGPLSVFGHPWMILIISLLMMSIVLVPVTLSVLYKLWVSLVFVAVVAVVGHCPLLAVFLILGMVLASSTPLRSNMPFLAVLIGLLPPMAYLYFFAMPSDVMLEPLQRLVLYVPLLLALVSSIISSAIVLTLARLTKYRPGVIWPVVLISLVVPVAMFYCMVGSSEFEYALIASSVSSGDAVFRPVKLEEFRRDYPATRPADSRIEAVLTQARSDLAGRQDAMLLDCAGFARRHPDNPHLPAVLWVRAAIRDVCLDDHGLDERMIRYQWHGPSELSLAAWDELAEKCPDSPQGMAAQAKLGLQAAREGKIKIARERLHIACSLLNAWQDRRKSDPPDSAWDRAFVAQEDAPGAEYYRDVVAEASEILWLMDVNKVGEGDARNDAAFGAMMKLWPFRELKAEDLATLSSLCNQTELADELQFLQALCEVNEYVRAAKLADLAQQSCGAAVLANYELGRLAVKLQNQSEWKSRGLKEPAFYLQFVCDSPDNPYKSAARELLTTTAGSAKGKLK